MNAPPPTNIRIAGLGGMGVLTASAVLADAAFRSGHRVKKAEVHGMSQRGGSVASDVRFGAQVLSPMIPPGEVDFLLALSADWAHLHVGDLRPGGRLLAPDAIAGPVPPRSLNLALLGALSRFLALPEEAWQAAIAARLAPAHQAQARTAFDAGRASVATPSPAPPHVLPME